MMAVMSLLKKLKMLKSSQEIRIYNISLFVLILASFFIISGCNNTQQPAENSVEQADNDGFYGEKFDSSIAIPSEELSSSFVDENKVELTVSGKIAASCAHSGCWMDIDLGDDQLMNVTFKDGDFTIPLDASGSMTAIHGIAYRELVPAERLRAYARDEGKSEEEINAITEDRWEYTFVASGVTIY
jgi:hypothetical protein